MRPTLPVEVMQVDNRGATLEERPEEALDRIRRRVRAADFGARVQTRPKKAAVTDRDLGE